MSLVTFLAGFSGVVTVFRKEIPMTLGSVKGKWAVIQGMAFTIFCWGYAMNDKNSKMVQIAIERKVLNNVI